MAGLVEEIQRDAVDPNTSVSTLLRKVKLAAAKLQLPAIEDWVHNELSGYRVGPVPSYRKLNGTPKAYNPYNGWIPIIATTAKQMEYISRANTGQSIASIEDLVMSGTAMLQQPLDDRLVVDLNKRMRVPLGEMANFIGKSELVGILDHVRTMVLDWAIELEKSGVKGEGMSFKPEEKLAAQNNPAISIGTFIGVLGNNNQLRDIVGGDLNVTQVRDLAQQLHAHHASLVAAGANEQVLNSAVDGLLIETGKAEPNQGVVRGFLTDARAALAGAAGNLLASGALSTIATMLGS